MRKKITKSVVDAAKAKDSRYVIWDSELRGFGIRVNRDGSKSYVLKFMHHRRQRWYTIARHGVKTPEMARKDATRLLGLVADGIDPANIKAGEKSASNVAELCDQYLAEGCATKKPSTVATDTGRINRHIKPLLGSKRVKDITSNDVRRFLKDVAEGKTAVDEGSGVKGSARVTGGKGTATRTVGLLGGIFSFAVAEGLRSDNPVQGVPRFPDKKNDRYLNIEELGRLGAALVEAEKEGENPEAIAAIRLLMLSGCRKSEVLNLRWLEIDFGRGVLTLADSKTGAKIVPLGAPALELLASLPQRQDNPYVFPGKKVGQHLIGLPKVWLRITKRAGIEGVRLHDLRHSFASIGASAGMGIAIVGKLLGHRDPKTTAQYAHIADDPAKAAADRIAGSIANAINPAKNEDTEVVSFERKTRS